MKTKFDLQHELRMIPSKKLHFSKHCSDCFIILISFYIIFNFLKRFSIVKFEYLLCI